MFLVAVAGGDRVLRHAQSGSATATQKALREVEIGRMDRPVVELRDGEVRIVIGPGVPPVGGAPHPAVVAHDQAASREGHAVLVDMDAVRRIRNGFADLRPARPVELPKGHASGIEDVRVRRIHDDDMGVIALIGVGVLGVCGGIAAIAMDAGAVVGRSRGDLGPHGCRRPGVGRLEEAEQSVVMARLILGIVDAHIEDVRVRRRDGQLHAAHSPHQRRPRAADRCPAVAGVRGSIYAVEVVTKRISDPRVLVVEVGRVHFQVRGISRLLA